MNSKKLIKLSVVSLILSMMILVSSFFSFYATATPTISVNTTNLNNSLTWTNKLETPSENKSNLPDEVRLAVEERVMDAAVVICDLSLDMNASGIVKNDKYATALKRPVYQVCNSNMEKVKAVVYSSLGRILLEIGRMTFDAEIRKINKLQEYKLVDIVDQIYSTQIEIGI